MKTPPHAPNCPCFIINALNDKVLAFKMPDGGNWYIDSDEEPRGYWRHIWAALEYKAWMMEARRLKEEVDAKDKATADEIDEDFMVKYIALKDDRWKAWDNANLWLTWEKEA